MAGPIYALDTNVFMDWQARYYPTDIFASLTTKIDGLIGEGRLYSPALAKEELGVVGTAELVGWANSRDGIWIPTEKLLAAALAIQGRFPGLRDPKAEYEEADAYVIALAQLHNGNGIVVTQETSAAEKRNPRRPMFIPDVCRELGVTCISLQGLMRREKWVF
ncbi:MAG: DUF4411 family protein [Opitutus sp.]|nr:DUF4411 family protein [Opitutus sp.]